MSEKTEEDKEKYVNDSLVAFLTTSLNVELVHVILSAITRRGATIQADKNVSGDYIRTQRGFFKEKPDR